MHTRTSSSSMRCWRLYDDFAIYVHLDASGRSTPRRSTGRAPGRAAWTCAGAPSARCGDAGLAAPDPRGRATSTSWCSSAAGLSGAVEPAPEGRMAGCRPRTDRLRADRPRWLAGPHRYQYFYREGGGRWQRWPARWPTAPCASAAARAASPPACSPGAARPGGRCRGSCLPRAARWCATIPAMARFFRTVLCPDELFFQTLVMASPPRARLSRQFPLCPVAPARRSQSAGAGRGRLRAHLRSGAHFCRKLDSGRQRRACCRCAAPAQSRAPADAMNRAHCLHRARPAAAAAPTSRPCSAPRCRATACRPSWWGRAPSRRRPGARAGCTRRQPAQPLRQPARPLWDALGLLRAWRRRGPIASRCATRSPAALLALLAAACSRPLRLLDVVSDRRRLRGAARRAAAARGLAWAAHALRALLRACHLPAGAAAAGHVFVQSEAMRDWLAAASR